MHLFYYGESDLKTAYVSGNNLVSLNDEEAAHLKVMRLRQGESVLLTDGVGNFAKASLEESGPKRGVLSIYDVISVPHADHYIHIAVAPTKNIARFEWFLEKATEMGIDEITPFYSEHSERVNLRTDRLNKVIISAMKQSLKAYMPKLNEAVSLRNFLNRNTVNDNAFIAWLDRNNEQRHLKTVCKLNKPATVLIGPEGDFSEEEVNLAKEKGFIPVSLGSSRLRTETAALAACFIVNLVNEPEKSGYPLSFD